MRTRWWGGPRGRRLRDGYKGYPVTSTVCPTADHCWQVFVNGRWDCQRTSGYSGRTGPDWAVMKGSCPAEGGRRRARHR